jgi:hypothetical protein
VDRLLLEIITTSNNPMNRDIKESNLIFMNNVECLLRHIAILNPIKFEINVRSAIDSYLNKFKDIDINDDISETFQNRNEALNTQKGENLSLLSGLLDHCDLLITLANSKN